MTDSMIYDARDTLVTTGWRRGVVVSVVGRMNEVTLRRVRLLLEWVAVFGRLCHPGMLLAN